MTYELNWSCSETQTTLAQLRSVGYAIIQDCIPPSSCDLLATCLDEIEAERRHRIAQKDPTQIHLQRSITGGQVFLRDLIMERPDVFLPVISRPQILGVLNAVIQDTVILDGCVGSRPLQKAETDRSKPHIDSHIASATVENTLDIVVFHCVDDFQKDNGATLIWPYSHKTGVICHEEYGEHTYLGGEIAEASKGSLIFVLGQTWHQIGENISGGRRWGILSHYKRWWIKPTTDYTRCGRKIFDMLTEEQKVLLGFSSRPPAYGSIRLKTKVIPSDVPKDYDTAIEF